MQFGGCDHFAGRLTSPPCHILCNLPLRLHDARSVLEDCNAGPSIYQGPTHALTGRRYSACMLVDIESHLPQLQDTAHRDALPKRVGSASMFSLHSLLSLSIHSIFWSSSIDMRPSLDSAEAMGRSPREMHRSQEVVDVGNTIYST